jgi:carboxyl-terminal processing protease
MQRLIAQTKWIIPSVLAIMLSMVLVAGYMLNTASSDGFVQAQGNQPVATQELFKPFWEAWNLLHEFYVDPLDDQVLMEGALNGMASVVDEPDVEEIVDDVLPEEHDHAADSQTDDIEKIFEPFWEVWDVLHERYPDSLDDYVLMEHALIGMMVAVGDPHTDYMDPETYAAVNESMSGEYEGIGATVRQNEETGGLELISIMEGSPAEKAGLRPGDQIVMVEGEEITDLSQSEIITLVRGPAGSSVRLGILRPGKADILEFEVVRDRISISSVSYELMEGDIGYVRISQFEFATTELMREALEEMDANNLSGLILDVRSDPGGYLSTSIEVASAYIQEGPIVLERGPGRENTYEALGNAIAPDVPMVVLVDQGSASASELIAGALQDRGRATIVGMPTFGKGSVQTWRDLSNGGGIRITISRWYTPDGHSVSEVGIKPDIEVPVTMEDIESGEDPQLAAAISILDGTYEES